MGYTCARIGVFSKRYVSIDRDSGLQNVRQESHPGRQTQE